LPKKSCLPPSRSLRRVLTQGTTVVKAALSIEKVTGEEEAVEEAMTEEREAIAKDIEAAMMTRKQLRRQETSSLLSERAAREDADEASAVAAMTEKAAAIGAIGKAASAAIGKAASEEILKAASEEIVKAAIGAIARAASGAVVKAAIAAIVKADIAAIVKGVDIGVVIVKAEATVAMPGLAAVVVLETIVVAAGVALVAVKAGSDAAEGAKVALDVEEDKRDAQFGASSFLIFLMLGAPPPTN